MRGEESSLTALPTCARTADQAAQYLSFPALSSVLLLRHSRSSVALLVEYSIRALVATLPVVWSVSHRLPGRAAAEVNRPHFVRIMFVWWVESHSTSWSAVAFSPNTTVVGTFFSNESPRLQAPWM